MTHDTLKRTARKEFALFVFLLFFGVVIAPIFIPTVLAAWALGGLGAATAGLERRIKKRVLQRILEVMNTIAEEAPQKVSKEVEKAFQAVEKSIMKEVGSLIEGEKENIESIMKINRQNMEEKEENFKKFQTAISNVTAAREMLKDAMAAALQVA